MLNSVVVVGGLFYGAYADKLLCSRNGGGLQC